MDLWQQSFIGKKNCSRIDQIGYTYAALDYLFQRIFLLYVIIPYCTIIR